MQYSKIKLEREGKKYLMNNGKYATVIRYYTYENCTIKFEDGVILNGISFKRITEGDLRNLNDPTVYGVGFQGFGKFSSKTHKKCYTVWYEMLRRSYCNKYQTINPTYKNCSVCKGWHNFQNFGEWFYKNYKEGFDLDKDILFKGNKTYSPETCVFVPKIINSLFREKKLSSNNPAKGIHIKNKGFQVTVNDKYIKMCETIEEAISTHKIEYSKYVREIANIWKNKIDHRVYEILLDI